MVRSNWLNPSDLVRTEPEVVAGLPNRREVNVIASAKFWRQSFQTGGAGRAIGQHVAQPIAAIHMDVCSDVAHAVAQNQHILRRAP